MADNWAEKGIKFAVGNGGRAASLFTGLWLLTETAKTASQEGGGQYADYVEVMQLKNIVPNFKELFSYSNIFITLATIHIIANKTHLEDRNQKGFIHAIASLDEPKEKSKSIRSIHQAVKSVIDFAAPIGVVSLPESGRLLPSAIKDLFGAQEHPIASTIFAVTALLGIASLTFDAVKIAALIIEASGNGRSKNKQPKKNTQTSPLIEHLNANQLNQKLTGYEGLDYSQGASLLDLVPELKNLGTQPTKQDLIEAQEQEERLERQWQTRQAVNAINDAAHAKARQD